VPKGQNALTGAAGEHYVAYRLSMMGYPVGLTRGGSPTVDLMVGSSEDGTAVSIQVKTSEFAHRHRKRDKTEWWSWRVGVGVASLRGDSIFYAFVSFEKDKDGKLLPPDTFIVPSKDVAEAVEVDGSDAYWFNLNRDSEKFPEWREAWRLIIDKLEHKQKLVS
jgi:hypothetical protein